MARGALMAGLLLLAPLAAAIAAEGGAGLSWHDAVATLAGERTRAETCVRIFKNHAADNPTALARGEMAYGEAKAEMDEVIAALAVAVTQGESPTAVDNLEQRIATAVRGREAFCTGVRALLPDDSGTRGVFDDLVGGAIEPVIAAMKDIYLHSRDQDQLIRKTIATQLEATRWPSFEAVQP